MNKCADCGYLAAVREATGDLVEVDQGFRDTGVPPVIEDARQAKLLCFVQADDLRDEMDSPQPKDVRKVVNRDYETLPRNL